MISILLVMLVMLMAVFALTFKRNAEDQAERVRIPVRTDDWRRRR